VELDDLLEQYPKAVKLKDGKQAVLRPLKVTDEKEFHSFFCAVPETERLLFKHRVTEPKVIRSWCRSIDYSHILPLVAVMGKKIVADASLHQQFGGWKRHIGRVSVVVHPEYRGRGLAHLLVAELVDCARNIGLEKLEAEFMAEQVAARHVFNEMGFTELLALPDYVKDMQAILHGYILMGRHLITDEEFAGTG
jgi:GNAT superfamily N-acetyltransferase